jgi:hypothetical protein
MDREYCSGWRDDDPRFKSRIVKVMLYGRKRLGIQVARIVEQARIIDNKTLNLNGKVLFFWWSVNRISCPIEIGTEVPKRLARHERKEECGSSECACGGAGPI